MGGTPKRLVVAGTTILLALTACSSHYDAYFSNQCATTVHVTTYGQPPSEAKPYDVISKFDIAPYALVRVERAFDDASGDQWSVGVDASDDLIAVDGNGWDGGTVVIPASMCPNSG
ncbi:MAG: hypothetical protein QOH90_639 [Actinomycetota bacterium]|nr:hypothetical protein [Actinomycetota bacterium]